MYTAQDFQNEISEVTNGKGFEVALKIFNFETLVNGRPQKIVAQKLVQLFATRQTSVINKLYDNAVNGLRENGAIFNSLKD
jgi:hypothetical protein